MKIDRKQVFEKYRGCCAYCGEMISFKEFQVDHIIPKRHAYKNPDCIMDDISNLNPACRVCNKWKGVWTIDEFRYEIEQQVNRLILRSAQFRFAEKYNLINTNEQPVVFYYESEGE